MEIFPKLVYKDKEFQESRPQEPTPEQLEYSEKVAREKLERIMDPKFQNFAVRYMNIEEYAVLLRGEEPRGEVILGGGTYKRSFTEYKEDAGRGQHGGMRGTDWHNTSGKSSYVAEKLISIIRDVEKGHKGESQKNKLDKIGEEVLEFLRGTYDIDFPFNYADDLKKAENKVSTFLPADVLATLKDDYLKFVREGNHPTSLIYHPEKEYTQNEFSRTSNIVLDSRQKSDLEFYLKTFAFPTLHGEANVAVFSKLENDPEYIHQPGSLREIVNALTYIVDNKLGGEGRQYEIALIFDTNIFKFKSSHGYMFDWSYFDQGKVKALSDAEKQKGIVAAIAVIPLKDLYKEMTTLVQGSGDSAHPIFDNRGALRWPERK